MKPSEKINLTFTIMGPVVIGGTMAWVGWSINAKLDLRQAQSDRTTSASITQVKEDSTAALVQEHQFVQDNFVSRQWFEKAQDKTNAHLESIDKSISQIQVDMAKIGTVKQKQQN